MHILPKMIYRMLQMAEIKLQFEHLQLAIATETNYEVVES